MLNANYMVLYSHADCFFVAGERKGPGLQFCDVKVMISDGKPKRYTPFTYMASSLLTLDLSYVLIQFRHYFSFNK